MSSSCLSCVSSFIIPGCLRRCVRDTSACIVAISAIGRAEPTVEGNDVSGNGLLLGRGLGCLGGDVLGKESEPVN